VPIVIARTPTDDLGPVVAGGIRADPLLMAHSAAEMLTASAILGEGARRALLALDAPDSAYGCTGAARRLARILQTSGHEVRATVARLTASLEGDADRLYRIAFAWQEADESAARRVAGRRQPGAVAGMDRPSVR